MLLLKMGLHAGFSRVPIFTLWMRTLDVRVMLDFMLRPVPLIRKGFVLSRAITNAAKLSPGGVVAMHVPCCIVLWRG